MKKHPPGRCLDQSCKQCWGPVADKPVFPRPASMVAKFLQEQEYDQQLRRDALWAARFIRSTAGGPFDSVYCPICGGPCIFSWIYSGWSRRSPYDNGNVIEGEVVHSHTQKELTQ